MKSLLRTVVTAAVAWGATLAVYAAPLYFVQISDTHIGGGGSAATRRAIGSINKLPMPISCVVHTGDVTADTMGSPEKVRYTSKLLSTLTPPLLVVPGNHDILADARPATRAAYTNSFGPLIQVRQAGPLRLVAVYTEPLARGTHLKGYDPLKELAAVLDQAPQAPTIICHHTPSAEDFYKNRLHRGWADRQRTAWRQLLSRYNVKAILCGHFHRGEQHWLGDIPIYVGPAIANYWGRTPSYRLYRYEDGRLSFHTVYLPE